MSRQPVSRGDFNKFTDSVKNTYVTKNEIQAANYATKGDLAAYQPVGNYALKSDLSGYQPKGNYALASALSEYQPKGDYALNSTLSGYQPKGDYALNNNVNAIRSEIKAANYATKGDLSAYQPKGDYALASAFSGYQPKGDYATKGDLSGYQPKGDYALASAFSGYQPKGDYALRSDIKAAAQGPAGKDGAPGAPGPQGPAGKDGAPGAAGKDGAPGAAGKDGAPGPAGPAGKDGAQGPAGKDGEQGPAGPQGIPGAAGKDGAQGPAGPQGIPGATGAQGPAGPQGIPGAQGPAGPQGIPGERGPAGITGEANFAKGNISIGKEDDFDKPSIIIGGRDHPAKDTNIYSISFSPYTGMGIIPNDKKSFSDTQGVILGTHIKGQNEWGVYSDGWDKLFAIQAGTGKVRAKGDISTDANVNIKGDLAFNGVNPWIIHTPDDNRRTMYVAPKKADGSDWDWSKQTMYHADGNVQFSNNITAAADVSVGKNAVVGDNVIMSGKNSWILHTPDDGRKQLYVAPGTDGGNWDWSKQTQFMADGNVKISGGINNIQDTRKDNFLPEQYFARGQGIYREFKESAALDLPVKDGYAHLETIVNWPDFSGGPIYQYAHRGQNEIYMRVSGGDAMKKWGAWSNIAGGGSGGTGSAKISGNWELRDENGVAVLRNTSSGKDSRYAFFPNELVDVRQNMGATTELRGGQPLKTINNGFRHIIQNLTEDGKLRHTLEADQNMMSVATFDDNGNWNGKHPLRIHRTIPHVDNYNDNKNSYALNAWGVKDGGWGVIFKNGPERDDDGGRKAFTIRNDDGNLRLMSNGGNVLIQERNILGEIDSIKATGGAGSIDFDAFSNGNDAQFSKGWQVGGDWPWDPVIRGPGRGGYAHTENKDGLGPDWQDNDTRNRTADIKVPAAMKSGFLFHLPWSNCRHFDIWGVLANGKEVFIRRVNAYQNVRNASTDNLHDAVAVVPIPRVDRFGAIRIKGVRGRIHYMGTGWTKNNLDSYASGADSGFVSSQNIVGQSLVLGTDSAEHPDFAGWTGANFRRRDGKWTHFDWKDNGLNYIRGNTQVDGIFSLQDNQLRFRDNSDGNHYIGFSGAIDGPRVQGFQGGQLGTGEGGEKTSLTWNKDGVNVNGQVCIGPRWCIVPEGEHLIFRDRKGEGDKRYAMFSNRYVDIVDPINNGQSITIRSDKDGQQRRLQRSQDNLAKFENNNRGGWEQMFIEKL